MLTNKLLLAAQALNIPYTVKAITGRPLIVTEEIEAADAFIVAWPVTKESRNRCSFGSASCRNYHSLGQKTWLMSPLIMMMKIITHYLN